MRCTCCNNNLNDFDSTARGLSGNYLDMCKKCRVGIPTIGRPDLEPDELAPNEWFDIGDPLIDPLDDSYFDGET